jgi:FMN reductase
MYSPGEAERTPQTERLVAALRRCNGVIISAPSYHGSVSGMVKNALDYAEDLKLDDRSYLDGLAVGCIACAAGWQAAGQTLAALRSIAHALRGWPTPLGAMLNTSSPLFDHAGGCVDFSAKVQLETIGKQVVEFAGFRASRTGAAPELHEPPTYQREIMHQRNSTS